MSILLPDSHFSNCSNFPGAVEENFPALEEWKDSFRYFSSQPRVKEAIKKNFCNRDFHVLQHSRLKRIFSIFVSLLWVVGLLSFCAFIVFCISQTASFSFSISVVLSLAIPMVLAIGGLGVLIKVSRKKDVFTGKRIGFSSNRQVLPVVLGRASLTKKQLDYIRSEEIQADSPTSYPVFKLFKALSYLDLSGLDEKGTGIAPSYFYTQESFVVPASLTFSPFFGIAVMCYNLLRMLIVPFYILYRILIYEKNNPHYTDSSKKFRFSDIPRETIRSLFNVLKAPFYTAALITALGYSLLEPLSGRILIGALERDWNNNILLDFGTVNIHPNDNWMFEGGGERSTLGNNATYLLGCCQPSSLFLFKEGKIVNGSKSSIIAKKLSQPPFTYAMVVPFSEMLEGTFEVK